MKLQIGDKAPDFTTTASIRDADGRRSSRSWTLSEEARKRPVLLVFYPGDFTSVCTKQLCDYRDNWERLKTFNVEIVGVSANDKDSHAKFAAVHDFPFALLEDTSKEICEKMGMLMAFGLATQRGFVLIDSSMTIRYVFRELLPFLKRSASEVAEILRAHVPV